MSTGINIKKLHHVILASSYRSKIKILQSIGRGLRKHESKSKLIVWDIVDDLSWDNHWNNKIVKHKNYVFKHWEDRKGYYDAQGFKHITKVININDIINI
jgi:superfamily II DNA or RNA helicase